MPRSLCGCRFCLFCNGGRPAFTRSRDLCSPLRLRLFTACTWRGLHMDQGTGIAERFAETPMRDNREPTARNKALNTSTLPCACVCAVSDTGKPSSASDARANQEYLHHRRTASSRIEAIYLAASGRSRETDRNEKRERRDMKRPKPNQRTNGQV